MNQQDFLPRTERPSTELQRCALDMRRQPTAAERLLWSRLRANRLDGFHFRRQCVIAGYIVDFYCHQARLVVEVDGSVHDHQKERDAERDAVIRQSGVFIMRVTNEEVEQSLFQVMRRIRNVGVDRSSSPWSA